MSDERRTIEWTEEPHFMLGKNPRRPGDRDNLLKAEADQFIAIGVAKDPETGEQNERKVGNTYLYVDDLIQRNS